MVLTSSGVKRFPNKDGSVREYLYVVKGVRVDGNPHMVAAIFATVPNRLLSPCPRLSVHSAASS